MDCIHLNPEDISIHVHDTQIFYAQIEGDDLTKNYVATKPTNKFNIKYKIYDNPIDDLFKVLRKYSPTFYIVIILTSNGPKSVEYLKFKPILINENRFRFKMFHKPSIFRSRIAQEITMNPCDFIALYDLGRIAIEKSGSKGGTHRRNRRTQKRHTRRHL
jgi:hypothetical protein